MKKTFYKILIVFSLIPVSIFLSCEKQCDCDPITHDTIVKPGDTVVKPADSASYTVVFQSGTTKAKDACVRDYPGESSINQGTFPALMAHSWSNTGIDVLWRAYIEFNLSQIPTNSKIESAVLYLYCDSMMSSTQLWLNGIGQNYLSGNPTPTNSNACYLKRVTGNWDELTINWVNQPTTSETNKVTLAASTSKYQDYEVNVTQLVKDMIADPANSHGFMFMLQNEIKYRTLFFASSDNENASLHPKLVVKYKK